jgi:hypothetical protein
MFSYKYRGDEEEKGGKIEREENDIVEKIEKRRRKGKKKKKKTEEKKTEEGEKEEGEALLAIVVPSPQGQHPHRQHREQLVDVQLITPIVTFLLRHPPLFMLHMNNEG